MAALVSSDEVVAALETILANPNHVHFTKALEFCAARGYGVVSREGTEWAGKLEVVIRQELPRARYETGASGPGLLGGGGGGGSDGEH